MRGPAIPSRSYRVLIPITDAIVEIDYRIGDIMPA